MAQISDVIHASAVFDAARQELAWAYSGDFTDVPEPMKGAVHSISKVLNEAEMRWVEQQERMVVVEKENAMVAVVATGGGEKKKKREDAGVVATGHETEKKRDHVGVVKEVDTRSIGEAERIKRWLVRLEEVACDMRAVARKELLGDYSRIDNDKLSARRLPCLSRRTSRADIIAPTIDTVALKLKELKKQYDKEFGYSTGLPLADTCMEQPACSSGAGGQEGRETSVTGDVLVERDDDAKQRIIDIIHDRIKRRSSILSATILPIIGPPGVGKTTLVKSVFHEGSFGAGYKVWVDMRKGWGIKEIHESIIEVLGRHHFAGLDLNKSRPTIRKVKSEADYDCYIRDMLKFNKTRLLLVFNNLVEEQDPSTLDELLKFLRYCGKLVITIMMTRSEDFASCISGRSNLSPYRLHPCSDNMCWKIIKRTSCIDLEATGTAAAVSEMVGCEIASKCSGIPLAAKALGRFLQSVDPQEWPVLVRDVWNIGGGFSCDSQQLRLPTHSATVFTHLRSSGVSDKSWLSLAYCAFVFPKGKDHGVVTRDLLNQWCALGITTRKHGTSCILELLYRSLLLGEKGKGHGVVKRDLLKQLLDRSLLGEKPASGKGHRVVKRDLLKQLLDRSLLLGEKPASQSDGEDEILASEDESLASEDESLAGEDESLASEDESLASEDDSLASEDEILAGEDEILAGEDEILAAEDEILAATLRMEDLMHDFARYHLGDRLIIVDETNGAAPTMPSSPVNSNKSSGARLALVSNFDAKPQRDIASILPAAGILALRFEGCGEMELNEEEFASAKYACLRLLDLSGCSLKKLPNSIRHLKQLRYLRASGITGLSPDQVFPITGLHELRYLILRGSCQLKNLTEEFQRLSNLLYLDLSGCFGLKTLPDSFGRLWRLERLDMSACSGIEALPESFGCLPSLSHLDLSCCSGLEKLPESFGGLHRLWHLNMSGCSGLGALPESFGELTSLWHLDLSGCSGLHDPRPTSFEYLTKLRHLDLSGLSRLQDLGMLSLPKELRHLNLSGCSGLQELPYVREPCQLRHLNLSGCSSLTKLPRHAARGLKHLDLSGCFSVKKFYISDMVEDVRSRGGRASEPKDASLSEQGTSGTTN